jgi:hypothetical protein
VLPAELLRSHVRRGRAGLRLRRRSDLRRPGLRADLRLREFRLQLGLRQLLPSDAGA